MRTWIFKEDDPRCPLCKKRLYKRYEGYVCKNFSCDLYHKLEKGWVYNKKTKEDNLTFFKLKYDFDITSLRLNKEWLKIKSFVLRQKGYCEICKSNNMLEIHHILSRSKFPELSMDKENLIVLCQQCHKKIHEEDKYAYR